jgi:putative membrane protein
MQAVRTILGDNPDALASFLSAPTSLVTHAVYAVANNGSSMSPFYTCLSLWIGSIFLLAVARPEVEAAKRGLKNVRPWQEYLGRYATFGIIALLQGLVVCLGNVFFLGIQCEHFWLYLLTCLTCALVFSSFVFTMTLSFGNIGKALCIVLMVMQLAGSGGIFPVQMCSDFCQAVYPWLPFSHAMPAMQSCIAGIYGSQYAAEMGLLCAYLVPVLLLGLVLRRPLIRAAKALDRSLDATGML